MMDDELLESILKTKYPNLNEEHLTSAKQINKHFGATNDVKALKKKLVDAQKALPKQDRVISASANLLYAIAAVQSHLNAKPEEKQLELHAFLKSLEETYSKVINPKGKKEKPAKECLDGLLHNGKKWTESVEAAPSSETTALSASLYPVFSMIANDIAIAGASYVGRATLYASGINADEVGAKLEGGTYKEKGTAEDVTAVGILPDLERVLNSKPEQTTDASAVFLGEDIAQYTSALNSLSELIDVRKAEETLQAQLEGAERIRDAVNQNEKKTVNRQYALELINANRGDFDALVKGATPEKQEAWETRMQGLVNPDVAQQLTGAGLSALSWAGAPLNAIYRATTTEATKDAVKGYVPATFDSESKDALKALAEARITAITSELEEKNGRVKEAKAAFVKSAFEGRGDTNNVADDTVEVLEKLRDDGEKAKKTLEDIQGEVEEAKDSGYHLDGLGVLLTKIRNALYNYFYKSPKERKEVTQTVEKASENFLSKLSRGARETLQSFLEDFQKKTTDAKKRGGTDDHNGDEDTENKDPNANAGPGGGSTG